MTRASVFATNFARVARVDRAARGTSATNFARAALGAIVAGALIVGPSSASAECLPANQRNSFESQLVSLFAASTLTIDQLESHVNDRLGFGRLPPVSSPDLTDAQRRARLAELIAESLTGAAVPGTPIDRQLAALQATPPVMGASPLIYRHASSGMTEPYSELNAVREQLTGEDDPDEIVRLQKLRSSIYGSLRKTMSARTVAQLVLSGAPDVGAVLGEFWFNHFNVSASKVEWSAIDYQKALSRRACGSFLQMLTVSAKHPAMLMYLDNYRSTRSAINENYGREILELHTFGDDRLRYYRQQDVIKVARVLTGWSVGFTELDANTVQPHFKFYSASHDPAALTLFANAPVSVPLTIPAATLVSGVPTTAAVARGEQLLAHLASHPATRANICRKLSIRLLGAAPADIVDGCVADAVWGTNGDLGAIYRYLLTRPLMWNNAYGNKVKNPIELVVSAHRRSGIARASVIELGFLRDSVASIAKLGIVVGSVPPPTGYEDDTSWRSAGQIVRFSPILFETLNVDNLGLRLPDRVLRGAALENYLRQQVTTAEASTNPDAALAALGNRMARDLLGFPGGAPLPDPASIATFRDPDTRKADREQTFVRSFVETALSNRVFMRK